MPQDPSDNGVHPDGQPTKPLPEVPSETAAGTGADAPTVAFEPVGATADDPIAPYVPIADPGPAGGGAGGGATPPPPNRRSPVPWLIGAAVLIMAAAIVLALWQPWAGTQPEPSTSPTPTQTATPTIPPIEPTEEPTSEPTPTEEPVPEPTQEPEPDEQPTEMPPPAPGDTTPPEESAP